jgi:sporulation protein YlmC with PRC-barrel domain
VAEITLVIGSEARTSDNKLYGYVKSIVVDRGSRAVTHLVIEPNEREGLARLVPLDNRLDAQERMIELHYTETEFKHLTAAEELLAEIFDAGPAELFAEGYKPADDEPIAVDGGEITPARATVTGETDLVPMLLPAEDEERRGDHVHATDGEIGQLRALCIDPGTRRVTRVRVLLKGAHLWRYKEVSIPSGSISGFTAGIHLSISRQQVQALSQGDPGG